jgi:Mn-dependent DtxR family transcriptional regulator
MTWQDLQDGILLTLVIRYEEDHRQFVTLPRQVLDSSSTRVAVAELRNEGLVEEQVRGVIRLTARGYKKYKTALSYACAC